MAVPKNKIKFYKDNKGQYYEFISCFKGYDYDGIVKRPIFGDPEGMEVNCCPFCDTPTTGGSWIPDSCPNCGAIEFMESWTRNIDYDPVNKKEETTNGLISIIKKLVNGKSSTIKNKLEVKMIKRTMSIIKNPYGYSFCEKVLAILGFYNLWDGESTLYHEDINSIIKSELNKELLIHNQKSTIK